MASYSNQKRRSMKNKNKKTIMEKEREEEQIPMVVVDRESMENLVVGSLSIRTP
jgi:hypothetical protein